VHCANNGQEAVLSSKSAPQCKAYFTGGEHFDKDMPFEVNDLAEVCKNSQDRRRLPANAITSSSALAGGDWADAGPSCNQ
jgi:hypothetical protein